MKLRDRQEHPRERRHIRPNQEQIHAHIQTELQKSGLENWRAWEESLSSLWEDAIDKGMSQEKAREILDETMRGVITYQRLNILVTEKRRMITSLFALMEQEIARNIQQEQGELQAPLSRNERRQRERQHQWDDDAEENLKRTNRQKERSIAGEKWHKRGGSPPSGNVRMFH